MRFEEAVARLSSWPDPLPDGPAALDPRVIVGRAGPPPWMRPASAGPSRDAAALVLVYPGSSGEASLVLIERPRGDIAHAGQVALPGGKREEGDAFPEGTALREASEEVGLDPASVGLRTLGRLGAVDVRVSGFMLVPVLAVAEREPALVPDPLEVARILRVPVRHFLPGAPIAVAEEERDGWRLRYGYFPVGEHRVWGATARVLGQLGALLGDP